MPTARPANWQQCAEPPRGLFCWHHLGLGTVPTETLLVGLLKQLALEQPQQGSRGGWQQPAWAGATGPALEASGLRELNL